MANLTTIAILPADRSDRRLRLDMLVGSADGARLRLTDETYSEAVGWFAQGHIDLSPSQVNQLRSALGAPEQSSLRRAARPRVSVGQRADAEQSETVLLSMHRAG